jgi:hypothetical protein
MKSLKITVRPCSAPTANAGGCSAIGWPRVEQALNQVSAADRNPLVVVAISVEPGAHIHSPCLALGALNDRAQFTGPFTNSLVS